MAKRVLLFFGVLTPILFIGIIILLGALFPGYNHLINHISELGALDSPVAGIMNPLGFMLTGILVVLFSIGLYRAVDFGLVGKLAILCLVIAGIFLSALGFFPCDPQCINISPIARMHDTFSQFLFIALIAAFFLFTFDSHPDESFRKFSRFSFVVAIILAVLGYIDLYIETPIPGFTQRIMVILPLMIMGFFGLRLSKKD